ncbi:lipase chaperone family protein [Paraglaciecola sp. 20A4]|uniref:lipase chaperone family protein n=1 Tax=Paraglaciecola sp. 20A4 TaxID=2687288 RepID=UPI00140DD4C3|nr:lipase chaperone family protein [Paraglaciecola sp. 20A4]
MRGILTLAIIILGLGGVLLAYHLLVPSENINMQPSSVAHSPSNNVISGSSDSAQIKTSEFQEVLKPHWFNEQLKDRLDSYIVYYQENEKEMWQSFRTQCSLFADCHGLTALLVRYIDYKKALVEIDGPSPRDVSTFVKRMDDLHIIRERFFTPAENTLLFTREIQWDEGAIQRLEIQLDPTLDLSQKRDLLEAHIASLPESSRSALQPTFQLHKLMTQRQQGDESTESYNTLAAEFGEEAAERLIALKKQRENWQQRIGEYLTRRRDLSEHYQDEQLSIEIQKLKTQLFTANEIRRIAVISEQ